MKINTTRFGEVEIQDDKIIEFPMGIPGFPQLKRYFIIDYKDPIKWLHAVDDPNIAFIVANPFVIFSDYSFAIEDEVEKFLGLSEPADIVSLVILTVNDDTLNANLKAPIVVNSSKLKAAQILLDDDRYSFRVPLPSLTGKE
jgi:flagellar assembly factor FliW